MMNIGGAVNGYGAKSVIHLSSGGKSINVLVHRAVMSTFRPVDQYPPIPLEDYKQCPQSVKEWIKNTVLVNHIDHNPYNNHLSNLEYTTPRDNSLKAVKHHGGHLNNKNK